ncbi:MAG TPA: hypothetical protein VIO13_10275 [Candidatus Dormibacteraeota bacterium]|jgi:hypothetical protein
MDQHHATAPICSRSGCVNQATFPCSYVDRRRRPCGTEWCPNHGLEIKGKNFCARHASTVIAVGDEALAAGHLPELDNRVPSLVYWVGRDLDSDVPVILATVVKESDNETLIVDPVALVAGGGRTGVRRWERNWKVISHIGISQRVTLQVLEGQPTDIVLRVGQVVVVREKPPWIAARDAGRDLELDQDIVERRAFYARLHDAITAALAAEHALPYY